jgi:hypothetical protein
VSYKQIEDLQNENDRLRADRDRLLAAAKRVMDLAQYRILLIDDYGELTAAIAAAEE